MPKPKPTFRDTPLIDFSQLPEVNDDDCMVESYQTSAAIAASMAEALSNLVWPDNYIICNTEKTLAKLASHIGSEGEFIFDCETQGLNPWKHKLYCTSFWVGDTGYLVPFEHQMMSCIDKGLAQKYLKNAFQDNQIKRTGHNINFDNLFIKQQLGLQVGWSYCDTLIQSQVINPDPRTPHGLKQLCAQYGISSKTGDYKAQFGKTAWSFIQWRLAGYYAIHDCELTKLLKIKQDEILESEKDWKTGELRLKKLLWDVEIPMLNLTYKMTLDGMRIDEDYYHTVLKATVYEEYHKAIESLSSYIEPYLDYVEADEVVQVLESTTKLEKVFFDKLNIPLVKYITLKSDANREFTKRSLDKEAISGLSKTCEPMRLLGIYREWSTLKKLFVDTVPRVIVDGRIHSTFNSIGAATRRMSMQNLNLQQAPSRRGPLVRKMYIPEPGNIFMSKDVSGQEMRILANHSRDLRLLKFYREPNGLDIYSQTALDAFSDSDFKKSKTTKEAFSKMSKNERKEVGVYRDAKALVLGLGYGLGPASYARKTGKTSQEGKKDFEAYHTAYPGVARYHEHCKEFARKYGYITSILGGRRYLPYINDSLNKGLQAAAERAAMNMPIQSSAADQIKVAALKVWKLIHKNKWPIRIALIIHDEILFELPIEWLQQNEEAIKLIDETICTAIPLAVPVETSTAYEVRWGESVELEDLDDVANEFYEEA